MRISDVEAITGLSGKSIRLYEAKGLISTKRSDNSYRYFDDETVEKLKCIPVLRRVGISISDIQLWQSKVIGTEEMLQKRISQLKSESCAMADHINLCHKLMEIPDAGLWWEITGNAKNSTAKPLDEEAEEPLAQKPASRCASASTLEPRQSALW